MPKITTEKDISYGWNTGETGWGFDLNDTLRQLSMSLVEQWSQRKSTTVGLVYGYKGGLAYGSSSIGHIADGTITLTASATNYVERTPAGAVSANTSGFSSGKLPMAVVVTDLGSIVSVVDWRNFHVDGTGKVLATGGLSLAGKLLMSDTASKLVPGATSFSLRNNADSTDNLLMTDSGDATVRGQVTATQFNGSGAGLSSVPAASLTGTVASARIAGAYTGITALGVLSQNAGTLALNLAGVGASGYGAGLGFGTSGAAGFIDYDLAGTAGMRIANTTAILLGISSAAAYGSSTFTNILDIGPTGIRLRAGSAIMGAGLLANTATSGFLYIPKINGGPLNNSPVQYTGLAPICFDYNSGSLYIHTGTNWVSLTSSGVGGTP